MYREDGAIKVLTMGSEIVDVVLTAEQMVGFCDLLKQRSIKTIILIHLLNLLEHCGCQRFLCVPLVEQDADPLRRPIGEFFVFVISQ